MKQRDIKKALFAKAKNKVILALLLCVSVFPVFANTFNVNTTADFDPSTASLTTGKDGANDISLRTAILAADNIGGINTINLPAGTYLLSSTYGYVLFGSQAENITIVGVDSSNTIIDGSVLGDRIFLINTTGSIAGVQTTIQNVKFQNGTLFSDNFGGGAILAGGPTNALTITGCAFANNSIDPSVGTNGGAIAIEGGGTATISNSSFYNNSCPTGDAGAIWYDLQNIGNPSGSFSVTNCTFDNNSINSSTAADGGALEISTQGGNSGTFSATIDNNTFINNNASGADDQGGAISIDNGFGLGGVIDINYNRIDNNTSNTAPSALVIAAAAGDADAIDNWWGSNANPATNEAGGGGSVDLTNWIVLSSTETPSSVCTDPASDTSVITTSFLKTHTGSTLTTANISTLIGLPISFGTAIDGSLVGAPTVIESTGIDTVDFVASTVGAGSLDASIDNETLTPGVSVTAVSLPTGNLTVTQNVGTTGNEYLSSCQLLDSLGQSGGSPVTGSVTSEVWVEPSIPNLAGVPFVARHYQIEPASNPGSSTGTVTLYFTQQEFTDFNAYTSTPLPLPTGPTDAIGKSNLRVAKYSGLSGDGSGLPASYSSSAMIIDPSDANIVWESANNRWAVTFDVSSFSGFIIQTSSNIIPVNLIDFTATLTTGNSVTVDWNMANQSSIKSYLIEKSTDDVSFNAIASVTASAINSYSYVDNNVQPGTSYYRLGMVDADGKINYGPTAIVSVQTNQDIVVYPNPVTDKFFIKQFSSALLVGTAQLSDINGQVLQTIQITQSLQPVDVSGYSPGIYLLHFSDGSVYRIIKN
jgi:hypothetical protein